MQWLLHYLPISLWNQKILSLLKLDNYWYHIVSLENPIHHQNLNSSFEMCFVNIYTSLKNPRNNLIEPFNIMDRFSFWKVHTQSVWNISPVSPGMKFTSQVVKSFRTWSLDDYVTKIKLSYIILLTVTRLLIFTFIFERLLDYSYNVAYISCFQGTSLKFWSITK